MAVCCENVALDGPTQEQQYVDPLGVDEVPRFYVCTECGQRWWCTADPRIGYWVKVDDETALAAINGQPIIIRGSHGYRI